MADTPSPCSGVCRIEPATGWCLGCRRTIGEITRWGSMANRERRAVMAQLPARVGQPQKT
jgi:predicted Fe-S protein YdhL (DUF1289 family)